MIRTFLITILSVLVFLRCSKPKETVITISRSSAIQVAVMDTVIIDPPVQIPDSSNSNSCPIVTDNTLYFPTTIINEGPADQNVDLRVETGITAVDIMTGDTLWASIAETPSDLAWPLMGSLARYQDSLVIVSFVDSLYLFDSDNGEVKIIPYSSDMQNACNMNREIEGDIIFSALVFTTNGKRIAYVHYPNDSDRDDGSVYDIVVTDENMNKDCTYSLDTSSGEITVQQSTLVHEGSITDFILTDSSICFHTVGPQLFFEIGFDGQLIRNLLLGDDDRYGPVIHMAAPYEGFSKRTQPINENIVLDNEHLYSLCTGLSNNGITGAEILDTDLGSNTAVLYTLNMSLGWTKFSGNGQVFLADWFDIPIPYEGELYKWAGKDFYALIRLH